MACIYWQTESLDLYNLKWIPTNFFKCSTRWHIFYITLIRYRFSLLSYISKLTIYSEEQYYPHSLFLWSCCQLHNSFLLQLKVQRLSFSEQQTFPVLRYWDHDLRKLTNVSWTLSPGWEKFHLALLYVLPLLVSLMELVFLIQVKVGLIVCQKFTFCFTLFMKLVFLLQPHQSSWCSLALPYVQVLKFAFGKTPQYASSL